MTTKPSKAHNILAQLSHFKELPLEELAGIAQAMRRREFAAGEVIIRQGGSHGSLFVIAEGLVRVIARSPQGQETPLGVLHEGDFFGEMAFLTMGPRMATVTALTPCQLFELPRRELYRVTRQPILRRALESAYRIRLPCNSLARVPLFHSLSDEERWELSSQFVVESHRPGTVICRQGEPGDAFYVIWRGQVKVVTETPDGERLLDYLHEDDYFGEVALLFDGPRTATIVSVTDLDVLKLGREDFLALVKRRPQLTRSIRQIIRTRLERSARIRTDGRFAQVVSTVLEHGLTLSDRVLVCEREQCPAGCRRCELACQERHGRRRLDLDGWQLGYVDIPAACQHCTHAACVEVCLFDAISRDESGQIFINENCRGCSLCAFECPYQAITMVEVSPDHTGGLLDRLLASLHHRQPVEKADVCDRCHGYPTMACIDACPTGALELISVEEQFRGK